MNKQFWSKRAKCLTPYIPGEQPKVTGLVKLNTNEAAYPPSPKALEAMRQAAGETLCRYPDPDCTLLRDALAREYNLQPQHVFCGNGSDEVLSLAFYALFDSDRPVKFPAISYSFYPVYADYYDLQRDVVPMAQNFAMRPEGFYAAQGGVVLANPNAPTGIPLSRAEIRDILVHNPSVPVIIDEAYVDFGGESAVELIAEFPNLLVVHTMSKYRALAGLRVGYALGEPALIAALNAVKNSFNSYPLDSIALAGATAAVEDMEYYQLMAAETVRVREDVAETLASLGFIVCPSATNFLFIKHTRLSGEKLYQELRQRNILVRHWNSVEIEDYLRVTIGTAEEMAYFIHILKELVASD